jgi:hypothetical protein
MRWGQERLPLIAGIGLMGLSAFALPYPNSALWLVFGAWVGLRALSDIRMSARR